MRTILFYGNCQARALHDIFANDPVASGLFGFRFLRSHDAIDRPYVPLTDADYASCAILCEQVDWNDFSERDRLPSDCVTVRFPSLDLSVLWPFYAYNPYNERRGERFTFNDRIVVRLLERGMGAQEALAYYLNEWDQYKVDMNRLMEIERVRWEKRDARCDIKMGEVILARFRNERLFWSVNHPTRPFLYMLVQRIVDALSVIEPALSGIRMVDSPMAVGMEGGAMPIHPEIAKALGLTWYDPDERYWQSAEVAYTFEEYYAELIRYGVAKREERQRTPLTHVGKHHWAPPLRGATAEYGTTIGCHPDGFIGARLIFNLVVDKPISTVSVKGYCPEYHAAPIELTCSIGGDARISALVQPGSMFELICAAPIESANIVKVEIASSGIFNMMELGEGEDTRDLSVLLTDIEAR
jgi:hypothetical protein